VKPGGVYGGDSVGVSVKAVEYDGGKWNHFGQVLRDYVDSIREGKLLTYGRCDAVEAKHGFVERAAGRG
jgi:hypothetical protein